MSPGAPESGPFLRLRWTPSRLIILGAALALGPVVLDASVSLSSGLAFLDGIPSGVPYWLFLFDLALAGFLVPVGLFLALCGILLSVRALHPQGVHLAFRAGLGGAGMNLAAGLMLGVLNLSSYLLPLEFMTVDFVRTVMVVAFAAAVAGGLGTFLALCGIAVLLRTEPVARSSQRATLIRVRRGKSISKVGTEATSP